MPHIVLTADTSMMIRYTGSLYSGFISLFPRHIVQDFLFDHIICRPVLANPDGTTDYPVLSLRSVETILRNYDGGYNSEDIKIAHPLHLDQVVNEETRIIGITVKDPLGIGPATTPLVALFGGQPLNRLKFAALMRHVNQLKKRYEFKVILGGQGAWQLEEPRIMQYYGIDHLLVGEGERIIPQLFKALETDTYEGAPVIRGKPVKVDEVPNILGPTNSQLIEITRGCGKGCRFCSPNVAGRLRSFPLEKILRDAQVYLDAGIKSVTLLSEDTLRYGSTNLLSDEDAVLTLYKELFRLGIKRIMLTHASMITFAQHPELIAKLTKLIRKHGLPGYGCQPGLETGSGRLIQKYMPKKCYPRQPTEWPEVVREALDVMKQYRWLPCCTMMMGMPGEEKEDIYETIQLIQSLKHHLAFFFPLAFLPVKHTSLAMADRFARDQMTVSHWELLEITWKHNLRFFDRVFNLVTEGQFPLKYIGLKLSTKTFGSFLLQMLRKRKKEAIRAEQ